MNDTLQKIEKRLNPIINEHRHNFPRIVLASSKVVITREEFESIKKGIEELISQKGVNYD